MHRYLYIYIYIFTYNTCNVWEQDISKACELMSCDIFKSKHDAGLKQETEAGAAAGA